MLVQYAILHATFMCLSFWVAFGKTFRPIKWPVFWLNIFGVAFNAFGLIFNLFRLI